jgi:hypothetical protein
MIRWLRPDFFGKKSPSLEYARLSRFSLLFSVLFGQGLGSCDSGVELFHGGQNPSHGGGFYLASKGAEMKFQHSNNVAVTVV